MPINNTWAHHEFVNDVENVSIYLRVGATMIIEVLSNCVRDHVTEVRGGASVRPTLPCLTRLTSSSSSGFSVRSACERFGTVGGIPGRRETHQQACVPVSVERNNPPSTCVAGSGRTYGCAT